jgi:signal transduction histidine kinase
MCYALNMSTASSLQQTIEYAPPGKVDLVKLRRERGWRLWLAPRPFTYVSTGVYLGAMVYAFVGDCSNCGSTWAQALSVICLLALLALDRLDYWFFGEAPPARAGLVLLLLRLALATVIAVVLGWWAGMFLYVLIPYTASFYFGARGAVIWAVPVWIIEVALIANSLAPRLSRVGVFSGSQESYYYVLTREVVGEFVGNIGILSILVAFVVSAARVACLERANRAQVEQLLARLDESHDRLRAYSQQAISTTEEKNNIARRIHDRLGHFLAEVSVQLEKARALRSREPETAEQAVRDARHSISEALGDVRQSVAALRGNKDISPSPQKYASELEADTVGTGEPGAKQRKGWRYWLLPRPFDLVSTTLYISVFVMENAWADVGRPLGTWHPLAVGLVLLGLALIDRLEFWLFGERPPVPVGLLLLAVRVGLIAFLFFALDVWTALLLIVLIPYICFINFGYRAGYIAGGLVWLGLAILTFLDIGQAIYYRPLDALAGFAGSLLVITFLMAVIVATSRVVLLERAGRARATELLADLRAAYAQLAEYAGQVLAAIQERNSLARDIHDGLGHYLTAAGVQLEKALAYRSIDPSVADRAIADSQRLVSEALQEVRGTVGALKTSESRSLVSSMDELADRLDGTGIEMEMRIEGSEDGYSTQALTALFRAAQEGITNIQKHAGAKHSWLRLQLGDQEAVLDLGDDGQGFDVQTTDDIPRTTDDNGGTQGRGYGLQSMRERLELVGGSLYVTSHPGQGTHLQVRVPKAQVID